MKGAMMRRLAPFSITLALACTPAGDDVADAETPATSETTGDGDGDGDGDGSCYAISNEVTSVSVINCGFPQPCAEAEFADICETMVDYDPAVGACIVEQLAAGTQALHVVTDCPGEQFSESWRLQVFGDGTVLYVNNQFLDIGGTGYATWRALPDAAYFQTCQTDTAAALLDCIDGILAEECQLGEPSCP
jgi:hypothetical protein